MSNNMSLNRGRRTNELLLGAMTLMAAQASKLPTNNIQPATTEHFASIPGIKIRYSSM